MSNRHSRSHRFGPTPAMQLVTGIEERAAVPTGTLPRGVRDRLVEKHAKRIEKAMRRKAARSGTCG